MCLTSFQSLCSVHLSFFITARPANATAGDGTSYFSAEDGAAWEDKQLSALKFTPLDNSVLATSLVCKGFGLWQEAREPVEDLQRHRRRTCELHTVNGNRTYNLLAVRTVCVHCGALGHPQKDSVTAR